MNKLLLDTNVLVYAIDEDSKYFKQAQSIFSQKFNLFTTSKNLSEFLSVVTRLRQNPLTIIEALTVLDDFSDFITVLYPGEESFRLFKKFLRLYQPTGLKVHDYEILSISLASQIKTIATFNAKDFHRIEEIDLFTF